MLRSERQMGLRQQESESAFPDSHACQAQWDDELRRGEPARFDRDAVVESVRKRLRSCTPGFDHERHQADDPARGIGGHCGDEGRGAAHVGPPTTDVVGRVSTC